MRIGIIGSMQFTDKMLDYRDQLKKLGHEGVVPELHKAMIGKSSDEIEKIKIHQKNNLDAIRDNWRTLQHTEAVLVLNFDKNGIKNYIGANTFLEIGFAHVLGQKIFLLNPLPDSAYLKTELEAIRPVILNGDLRKIV